MPPKKAGTARPGRLRAGNERRAVDRSAENLSADGEEGTKSQACALQLDILTQKAVHQNLPLINDSVTQDLQDLPNLHDLSLLSLGPSVKESSFTSPLSLSSSRTQSQLAARLENAQSGGIAPPTFQQESQFTGESIGTSLISRRDLSIPSDSPSLVPSSFLTAFGNPHTRGEPSFRSVSTSKQPILVFGHPSTMGRVLDSKSQKPGVPFYDRSIDLHAESLSVAKPRPLVSRLIDPRQPPFMKSKNKKNKNKVMAVKLPESALLRLPPVIIAKILEALMPAQNSKIVTLDHDSVANQMYPKEHFLAPEELLCEVWGLMLTCRQMRENVMTHFWGSYQFYVTFSPFTKPNLCPLAITFLNRWAHKVQHLAVELDLTKLGCGADNSAMLLTTGSTKMRELLTDLVENLGKHEGPIGHLHLLCRRYAGFRHNFKNAKGKCEFTKIHFFTKFEKC